MNRKCRSGVHPAAPVQPPRASPRDVPPRAPDVPPRTSVWHSRALSTFPTSAQTDRRGTAIELTSLLLLPPLLLPLLPSLFSLPTRQLENGYKTFSMIIKCEIEVAICSCFLSLSAG